MGTIKDCKKGSGLQISTVCFPALRRGTEVAGMEGYAIPVALKPARSEEAKKALVSSVIFSPRVVFPTQLFFVHSRYSGVHPTVPEVLWKIAVSNSLEVIRICLLRRLKC